MKTTTLHSKHSEYNWLVYYVIHILSMETCALYILSNQLTYVHVFRGLESIQLEDKQQQLQILIFDLEIRPLYDLEWLKIDVQLHILILTSVEYVLMWDLMVNSVWQWSNTGHDFANSDILSLWPWNMIFIWPWVTPN